MIEDGILSLRDLLYGIGGTLGESFPEKYWVKAEISGIKARPGGHCYLELSQTEGGELVAKIRAMIWSAQYRVISHMFEDVTGSPLSEGMNVLVRVSVNFNEVYGLSLVVDDIDPEFTLGEREDRRRKTIRRLEEEGLMDLQKELAVPELPWRIAVVSAPDAAGYRDFRKHLDGNPYGFSFRVDLFPAVVQGVSAPASVADALELVAASSEPYDVVMIMRGGGAKLDMACFDEYDMAKAIAQCPVPVITGIGHDQDCHIADMAACEHLKTPTALADWLIDIYCREDEALAAFGRRLSLAFTNRLALMESSLTLLENRILSADPRNILRRGYTLTLDASGVVRKSAADFRSGDTMTVLFPDGKIECIVK